MGIVYKANQRSMARNVALKILSPKYASKPRFVEQFIREARAAGALNHPNIIQVHDVGTENNIHYFSMEFVDGPTCMQVLRENGPFPLPEALEIARQTAKALEYAHSQRLIHQDIKPDNIMLCANLVKLADLGISKTFDEAESEDGPKRVMGTPHYMAPEAALGKKTDHRVDIYSLGATLYHLLTGKTPYAGSTATQVLKSHVMDPIPAIQDLNPKVPDDVCALVERMTAKNPEDRYADAGEIASEIKRLQQGLGLGSERIASSETMILQRLKSGSGYQTPNETTGSRRSRSNPIGLDVTTGSSTRSMSAEAIWLKRVSIMGIAAVAIFLLIAAAKWLVPPTGAVPAPGNSPAANTNVDAPQVIPAPNPAPVDSGIGMSVQGAAHRHEVQLTALETGFKTIDADGDLSVVLKKLDTLMQENLNDSNLQRAKALRLDINNSMTSRLHDLNLQKFNDLKLEVERLSKERDYDIALSRIDSFRGATDEALKSRLANLRMSVTVEKKLVSDRLAKDIDDALRSKDGKRLRNLKEGLAPAQLGTDFEKKIDTALKKLDDENRIKYEAKLKQTAEHIAGWSLDKVRIIYDSSRTEMGDSQSGKQMDAYFTAATRLIELRSLLIDKIQSAPQPVRIPDRIDAFDHPDLINANTLELELRLSEGASVGVKWARLTPDDLLKITHIVLGSDADRFKPAIEQLKAAKALVAKP
jgi:serine/threonine protein kinase